MCTHPPDLATSGAWLVACQSHWQAVEFGKQDEALCLEGGKKRKRASIEDGGAQKKRRTGGGGPWRAFLHVRAQDTKLTASVVRDLRDEYRALTDAEMQEYREVGRQGSLMHRSGEPAFAPTKRPGLCLCSA